MVMMEAKAQQRQQHAIGRGHVLVLPYPSQGHINPLLQFAKRLAFKGLKVTIATTRYTLNSINATGLSVEPISDGFDDGGFVKAPDADTYVESFKKIGSATLSQLISELQASGSPVSCLVYDSFLPWALGVARHHDVFGASFLTNSAAVCSMFWRISRGLLTIALEDQQVFVPGLPPLRYSEFPSFLVSPAAYPAYSRVIMDQFSNFESADWVFANTFQRLESRVGEEMAAHWSVTMIGPMVPSAYLDKRIKEDTSYGANLWNPRGDQCLKWLRSKPPMSVVYVSFGSMAEVGAMQIEEIAEGLIRSSHDFIWVLRDSEHYKLPKHFLDSISRGEGLVVPWCNQLEVLAHEAIGCFVTHCGWNSSLEALSLGMPMVAIPQWTDQPTNAKFIEDVWVVGARAKVDEKGIVRRDELGKCIMEVMGSQDLKRNARKWSELAKEAISEGGSSDRNINEFVRRLLN